MTNTKRILLLCCGALTACILSGCAAKNGDGAAARPDAVDVTPVSPPPAPQGLRTDSHYVSALNEQCWRLVSDSNPAAATQAYCLRNGTWELLAPLAKGLLSEAPGTAVIGQ